MAIPKIIHYCWFGGGKKSELVLKCIQSWKKYCPDCEIIEWNERNYDISKNRYMFEAYHAKRWGFVSDYARLDIVHSFGGIYLDTDVEVIRELDELFEGEGFLGFELTPNENDGLVYVNTGEGFGANAGDSVIKELRDAYDNQSFFLPSGEQNLTTCPYYNTATLVKLGLAQINKKQKIGNLVVYPTEYFCPINWKTRECYITSNTFSVHHFDASWLSEEEKRKRKWCRIVDVIVHTPNRILKKILGKDRYSRLKNLFGEK